MPETSIQAWKCNRCAYCWPKRAQVGPKACPKCHSKYYDKPRRYLTEAQAAELAAKGRLER